MSAPRGRDTTCGSVYGSYAGVVGGGSLHTILFFAFGTSREASHQWAIRPSTTFAIHIATLRAQGSQYTTGNGATLAFYLKLPGLPLCVGFERTRCCR